MKTSILLLAASAGLALAQPASLGERGYSSGVCPTYGAPWEPTAACCVYKNNEKGYPAVVCLKATGDDTTAAHEESCHQVDDSARPRCCPKAVIARDENDFDHDDLLCTDPKTVA